MAAPDPGMVQPRQVRASFPMLLLVLALLPVLIPDDVCAFRIREGSSGSLEQTRSSCNPLFDKCAEQKVAEFSSTVASTPSIGLRRRFEGVTAFQQRTAKIQPLVGESDEVEDGDGRPVGASSHTKLRSNKVASLKINDNLRLKLRTPTVAKTTIGYVGRSGVRSKVSLENVEDDEESGGSDENYEDNTGSEGEDEDDDEEDDDDSADESDVSIAIDSAEGHRETDDTDEDEDKDETTESKDDVDNDDDESEREKAEDDDVASSEFSDDGIELKYKAMEMEQEVPITKKYIKVTDKHGVKSVDTDAIKIVENIEEVTSGEIAEEKRKDTQTDGNITRNDHVANRQATEDRPKIEPENIPRSSATKSIIENINLQRLNDMDEDKDDGSETEYEVTPPPRKLEKVRHADKSKSMEVLRAKSFEELPKQIETHDTKNDATEEKTLQPSKQTQSRVPESKQTLKEVEKVNAHPAVLEVKKPGVREKEKVTEPKKVTKPQPKQSENPKVRVPEVPPHQKSEKAASKTKKRTEAVVTLPELNDLLMLVPTFTPNFTTIQDPICQQHGKIFLRQLRGYKLWALQMLDSSAKVPSGLLRGNVNQLGDFDQCLAVKAHVKLDEKTVKVQGKYCLATVDVQATRNDMKIPVNLMQSRAFLRAGMNEPTHFVPRFTTANWALCVPAACSARDVQSVMEDALSVYNASVGLKFTVGVDPDSCYVKQKAQTYSKETVAVLYFYAMTMCLVLVATLRDCCISSEGPGSYSERIIMAFSLRRTTKSLLLDPQYDGDIRCIHGIRTLATIFLYVAHKLIPISRIPFANRISLTEVANNPLSSILRVSLVYTDSFLLLSGVLTAYNMAKELNKRGEIRWFCRFITRFIRLTPALLAVVFWYAFVMEHTGSGPQWNSVVKSNADLCKKNAWTNLLYVQNFFPFEEMCATHSHQLALDMQLSLIAPMLVFFLYVKPVVGILLVLFLLQVSATVRYLATTNNYLSLVIFHGMTLKQLYKTANLTYALSLHRATPYLFGVALGVLMRYTGKQVRIHKVLVIAGWLLAAALGSWSLLSPWKSSRRDYVYDVEEATYYAVTLPVCWAASLSWIIFASFTEHGGPVNKLLSSYWLVVLSRLSYSVYLTQFAVFFYNVGTTRYATEFQLHRSIDFYEAVTVLGVSVVLTLLLDLPMQEVKNVIMECTDGLSVDKISSEEREKDESTEAKNHTTEQQSTTRKSFVDEELESTGWDWQDDIVSSRSVRQRYVDDDEPREFWTQRKDENRRKSFVRHDAKDEEIPTWDWIKTPVQRGSRRGNEENDNSRTERRSQSRQEYSNNEYSDDPETLKRSSAQQALDEDRHRRRDVRSQSRLSESKRSMPRDSEDHKKRDDLSSRFSDGTRLPAKEFDSVPREVTRRGRSLAKDSEIAAASMWKREEQPSWEYVKRERSASQSARDSKRSLTKGLEGQTPALRSSMGSLPRSSELRKRPSSGSEEEFTGTEKVKSVKTHPQEEPRVSDDEGWEQELRLRRQKLAKTLPPHETGTASEEEDWSILRRRSSAEGKMALLNDSPEIDNFSAWSISKVPTPAQNSFPHEHGESEEDNVYVVKRNDYRETRAPFRESYDTQSEEETSWDPSRQQSYTSGSQPTSIDEEDGPSVHDDFVLRKGSKRTSLHNLSRISQEEPEAEEDSGWDFVKEENTDSGSSQTASTGLFKRASIVRSQASEEDPEYLLPERPKLVEQEQEHPFKKAWQMQKSRSEEDGPAGFLVKEKDSRTRSSGSVGRTDAWQQEEGKRKPSAGGQTEDLSYFGGDEAESTSVSYPASNSGDSANLDWVEEEERSSDLEEMEVGSAELTERNLQFMSRRKEQKRHSEESNWEWNQEET